MTDMKHHLQFTVALKRRKKAQFKNDVKQPLVQEETLTSMERVFTVEKGSSDSEKKNMVL